jgi:hypothetical protein
MANKRVITSDMFSYDKFMFFDDFTRILWVGLITVCARESLLAGLVDQQLLTWKGIE